MKKTGYRFWVAGLIVGCFLALIYSFAGKPTEAYAEELEGEGTYIAAVRKADVESAPVAQLDTVYWTDDDGYVKIMVPNDGFVYGVGDCSDIYDNALERVGGCTAYSDFYKLGERRAMYGRLKAGEVYYLYVYGSEKMTGKFKVSAIADTDDAAGDTKETALTIQPNQAYTGSIWGYETDCYKFTADVTGKAKITFQSLTKNRTDIGVKLTYFNSGETVESFESYAEDGTEPCTVSMNVVEGSTYLVSLIESHDFSLMNYTLEIDTAQVSEIKFPETFVSLNVKQSYQLQPTVLPENAVDRSVAYTSTNKKVATVDANGMVYAKGVGKASIICTAADSGGANSVVKVTVTSPLQTQSAKINVLTSQVSGKAKIFIAKSQYASGYEIQYSLNKSMKKSSVATSKSTTATIKKLTAGKKYYFRVRAYTVDGNGKKIYSKYSSIKSVKIKR